MLRVRLHAGKTPPKQGRRHTYWYSVRLNGQLLVEHSSDPETELARALLARGIKGTVTVLDGRTGKPRSRVNIERAARLRTVEGDRDGLHFRKHGETTPSASQTAEAASPEPALREAA